MGWTITSAHNIKNICSNIPHVVSKSIFVMISTSSSGLSIPLVDLVDPKTLLGPLAKLQARVHQPLGATTERAPAQMCRVKCGHAEVTCSCLCEMKGNQEVKLGAARAEGPEGPVKQ